MNLLVDLDGTLIDSRNGIVRCLRYALESLGRHVPQPKDLLKVIGPPISIALRELPDDDADDVARMPVDISDRRHE